MKYKLVAVDLDGTLLDDEKAICEYNIDRIRKAISLGVKFVLASGRVPTGVKIYSETVAKNQPVICCNGSILLDNKRKIIYSSPINKNSIFKVIDILRENKDTYYHFYDEDIMYTEKFAMSTEKFYEFNKKIDRNYRMEIRIIPDSKEFIEKSLKSINKIVVVDDDIDYLNELRKSIEKIEDLEVTSSDIRNIEIMNKGISKGRGLTLLSRYYNIRMEECIAVGNDENDISMIKTAGLGAAVANATQKVKEYADYITLKDNNDGAIGEIIDKFILN
ncbi:Cof subfamily protein (haloacid dehalogenase superfamily) [Clostridium algifaecis]|uniref:Cof subfamily protein (Haloacid dehalogenase superfamily) n=1 Tax=Clostridium algifaecis TaxID=1472040 RepID=A0ABS4KT54_9CLOT|nr:Cof subfamily protein (haloacid dehalogenase superfamily) [Clostridium algifaecis]